MSERKHQTTFLQHIEGMPYDPEAMGYMNWCGSYYPYMFSNWRDETMSWKNSCYIHAGLTCLPMSTIIKGPDTIKLLSDYVTNSLANFPIGSCKQGIVCSSKGNVLHCGLLMRTAEDEVELNCFYDYFPYIISQGKYDVTYRTPYYFIFQLAGPRSLEIVERAANEDIHDLKFMRFREATIAGHKIRMLRMGMGGSLSYEIHGFDPDAGIDVYNELMRVGEAYGIVKLGMNAYMSNHTENGYPQIGEHFPTAWDDEMDYFKFASKIADEDFTKFAGKSNVLVPKGSLSTDIEDYFRNPFELDWGRCVKFDHDFHGREALEKIAKNHRKMVTLRWNPEDVMNIFQSFYEKGEEPYKELSFPQQFYEMGPMDNTYSTDKVLKDGKMVGVSMWHTYTLFSRDSISLCCIDPEYSEIGTEVSILWGDTGKRQMEIRATVERYPYLALEANRTFDVNKVPRIK